MKKGILKFVVLTAVIVGSVETVDAQRRQRQTRQTTPPNTTAEIQPTAVVDTTPAVPDSLPISKVKPSLRPDEAVETTVLKDRIPLTYEHLRADDAVYRHKVWREIDTREKINLPFRYSADESNGNQRFISILLDWIQNDSTATVFSNVDDRFTTPMTKAQVAEAMSGALVEVPIYDAENNLIGTKKMANEVNLDSIYKFRIKEEVIFDKESSRLFWRILGIAPVKNIITTQGVDLGESEIFWAYYPDLRATFARYEVYNGKNYGARMSWEELFESRMFYGRIIKSTIDNTFNQYIENYKSLSENTILQLLEGESIKDKIFNYEQDLWEY